MKQRNLANSMRQTTLRIVAGAASAALVLILAAFQDGRVGAAGSAGPMSAGSAVGTDVRGPSDVPPLMMRDFITVPTSPASTVQAHVSVSAAVASLDGSSPSIVRVVSVTAVVAIEQVELAVLSTIQQVDITGSEGIILQAGGIHLGNALFFAHQVLREPAEPSSEDPLEYRVTVTPSGSRTWLDVAEHGDVSVIVDLID